MSRFAVKHSDQELLMIVREVTRFVSPDDPASVTQVRFDQAREQAGFTGVPRAYRIAKRLSSTWDEVLALAHISETPDRTIGIRTNTRRVRDVLTKAEVMSYLQRVADDLGTSELRVREYDTRREELVNEDDRRYIHRHGLGQLMPTAQTIIANAGSWENALAWAGLKPGDKGKAPPYPAELALDDFVADHGFAPTRKMLLDYQRTRGLATTPFPSGYREWLAGELNDGTASRHGKVRVIVHVSQAPDGWEETTPSPAPAGYQRSKGEPFTTDDCEQSIGKALDLARGQRLTQDLYQRYAKSHGLMSMSSIQRTVKADGLTWGDIRDRVIADRARTERQQPRIPASGRSRP